MSEHFLSPYTEESGMERLSCTIVSIVTVNLIFIIADIIHVSYVNLQPDDCVNLPTHTPQIPICIETKRLMQQSST